MSEESNKRGTKFVCDMQYELSKSKSCLISEISRSLDKEETRIIKENDFNEVKNYFPNEAISIFDDSDISKRYGKKFEDLDQTMDASDPDKKVVNGYYVCEAVILGKEEKRISRSNKENSKSKNGTMV